MDQAKTKNITEVKKQTKTKKRKLTFEERLQREEKNVVNNESMKLLKGGITGNRVMTFIPNKSNHTRDKKKEEIEEKKKMELKAHLTERKKLARRAKNLKFNRKKFS